MNVISRNATRVMLPLLLISSFAQSQTARPNGDNDTYVFHIGGATPFINYKQSNRTNINLHAAAEWSLFRGCEFDPRASIGQNFSDAQTAIYGFANDVVASVPGLLTSWGLSQVQENYPGVYEFMTKGLVDAKASFQTAVKSCQDMRNDADNGRNPVDGWFRISQTSDWDVATETGANPTKVKPNGNRGVKGAGGETKGGLTSAPIQTVKDIVEEGYKQITHGLVPDPFDDPATGNKNITRAFPDAASASKWAQEVLGERTVRTCTGCERLVTTIGQGLRYKVSLEAEIVAVDLSNALAASHVDNAMLNKLSVPGMGVVATENTLRAIKNAPRNEGQILASRYVSEIAMARVMEKALIIRDLINIGRQEPNIAANAEYQREIEYSKRILDDELDNIMYETRSRKDVLNNAASTLTEREYNRTHSGAGNQLQSQPRPSRNMTGGGINK